MGGKTKNVQRTKNNAKPSSSSRSAELLGTAPTFVGFSAYTDGLKALAPGFTAVENLPDSFDANISNEYQLVMRKLSKKDAMTKKKALQEFITLADSSDLETLKTILPLWPKYYHNLANDIDYTVRELSQSVLKLLASKCKRNMAPYLKQLVPMWLASRFDNYAPAASIAIASFNETFTGTVDRTQEVCLHCQTEIVDYAIRNLTFHTASTLSNGKGLTDEEAEQKYQRIVVCSLHMLSFLLEHISSKSEEVLKLETHFETLCKNNKFWNFSKHKQPAIRAAWFQFLYNLLLNQSVLDGVLASRKTDLISVSFQHIDDNEPLVAPQIWGCVLLLQTIYADWFLSVNLKKLVLPKLSQLLRNGFNKNAQAICPNILPFFSNLSNDSLPDVDIHEFYKQFFDDLKASIVVDSITSKADYSIIIKTYFECLRYLIQKLNVVGQSNSADQELAIRLLNENVMSPIAWCLSTENTSVKVFLANVSSLVAFWAQRQNETSFVYNKLLSEYWGRIYQVITASIAGSEVKDCQLEHLVEFLKTLQKANPSFENPSVKFNELSEVSVDSQTTPTHKSQESPTKAVAFVQKELKQLVIQLVRLCVDQANKRKSAKSIRYVQHLTDMFEEVDFYKDIGAQGTLIGTLNLFVDLIATLNACSECEILIEIIFKILSKLPTDDQFDYIHSKLFKIPQKNVQIWVLQRLLSYPLCIEARVRAVLAEPECCELIRNIAKEVVSGTCKDNIQILHKCFFQTHQDEILVAPSTVDEILGILSDSLVASELNKMTESCTSFIAQILPVVCSNQNASEASKRDIFLKLFKFSLRTVSDDDFISEDTVWEITTSWQDALSSGDIVIDAILLQKCADYVEQCLETTNAQSVELINVIAEAVGKFIMCSTENIKDPDERSKKIDTTMLTFFTSSVTPKSLSNFKEFCLVLEALKDRITLGSDCQNTYNEDIPITSILNRTLLNLSTISKLVCKGTGEDTRASVESNDTNTTDDEQTEDYCDQSGKLLAPWSEFLYTKIVEYIHIAATACALKTVDLQLDNVVMSLADELVNKAKAFMQDSSDIVPNVKERLLEEAAKETNTTACRALTFLVHCNQYAQFDENATILLVEDLSEYFISKNAIKAYVNSLQYLLPHLEQNTFTTQSPIMKTETKVLWLRAAVYRCLVKNNFGGLWNAQSNKAIIAMILQYIIEVAEMQNSSNNILLYSLEIHKQSHSEVINAVEYINLLTEVLLNFPSELKMKNWDLIRIGLSSWVLSVSKTIENYTNPKAALFITSVFKLFAALTRFISGEKQKSSTEFMSKMIDEWENLFSRDVNLVLFKAFFTLCSMDSPTGHNFDIFKPLLEEITPTLEYIDYRTVYHFCESSNKITLDNLCNFLLKNLSNHVHCLRMACVHMLRQLTQQFVAHDIGIYESKSDTYESQATEVHKWHYLNRYEDYITRYDMPIRKYLNEFSFKLSEISELTLIDRNEAFSYLLLWDCIIYTCAHAPTPLRAVYTNWLNENKYEENFLHFLFRAMPTEILKNHDSKFMNTDIFKGLNWTQLKDRNLLLEKYSCHLYTEVLRKLPALVRRWWNTSQSRQKTFVDKLTTNFVSLYICNEELGAIANLKDKHENMQVSVHKSTREVLAVYAIEDARMELVISLAQNYPLGGVKVECGKQIGGRTASRNLGMQLTIFLTHQNGTIFDGLTMWKNNLDKKFEGMEECYVCYTVIHQDTCQLPKLCCKTCKKKFHGPCLYKWFTTSSKSTCPLCRNVF